LILYRWNLKVKVIGPKINVMGWKFYFFGCGWWIRFESPEDYTKCAKNTHAIYWLFVEFFVLDRGELSWAVAVLFDRLKDRLSTQLCKGQRPTSSKSQWYASMRNCRRDFMTHRWHTVIDAVTARPLSLVIVHNCANLSPSAWWASFLPGKGFDIAADRFSIGPSDRGAQTQRCSNHLITKFCVI